ncbi:GPR1/FUN34/yaaH family-domain-containing protein [Chytriomyces sp. MP71]|nr:GPR1/FUN34/yaaH family-domain-containing protein [Chytriomyces sp. MP71]
MCFISNLLTFIESLSFLSYVQIGLCAFALTTFVLSLVNARADNVNTPNVIVGLSFAYGGFAQMIAGVQEFVVGNTFGSTAFTSYGAFWMSYGYILVPNSGILAAYKNSSELENALGFYLLGWTLFTSIMFFATLKANAMMMALFGFLDVTFLLLTIGKFTASTTVNHVGGVFGVITALIAWYVAAAQLITPESSYVALPVFPLPKAKADHEEVMEV